MVSRFAPLAVLSLALVALAQDPIRIETPQNVVVCRPVQFLFSGGTPPYFLTAHPAGQPAAPATIDFNTVESSPFIWTANQPVGTSLFLRLRDSNGEQNESGTFTVLEGPDTSCVGQEPSGSGDSSSTGAPSTTGSASGSSTASTPATSGSASRPASSASRPASSASGSGSARPSTSAGAGDDEDAALSNYISTGAIGLAAIAGAAVLL